MGRLGLPAVTAKALCTALRPLQQAHAHEGQIAGVDLTLGVTSGKPV